MEAVFVKWVVGSVAEPSKMTFFCDTNITNQKVTTLLHNWDWSTH